MDAIGSSYGILLIFLLAYGLPFILCVFSIILWGYKKFKRLAMVSYIVTIILTIIITANNIMNIISYIPWNDSKSQICFVGSILMGIGLVIIFGSIILYRKNKIVSNIFINISSIASTFIWFSLIKIVNL